MNFKKIGAFLFYLLPWFLSALLFRSDANYYSQLNRPFFAPPPFIFGLIWPILYLLIAYTIYQIWPKRDAFYQKILLINYFSNQLFSFFFFTIKNNFLSLVDTIVVLVSSLYLYQKTKQIDDKVSKFLIPYIIWNIFATVLIACILAMN